MGSLQYFSPSSLNQHKYSSQLFSFILLEESLDIGYPNLLGSVK